METCPLLAGIEHNQSTINGTKTGGVMADMQVLQEITNRYKAVQVDPAEFACLKAIVLFKPGIKGSFLLTSSFYHLPYYHSLMTSS